MNIRIVGLCPLFNACVRFYASTKICPFWYGCLHIMLLLDEPVAHCGYTGYTVATLATLWLDEPVATLWLDEPMATLEQRMRGTLPFRQQSSLTNCICHLEMFIATRFLIFVLLKQSF